MNKEEFLGKLQMCYFGERNAFDEIVSEYDRLNNVIDELEKWLKEYIPLLEAGDICEETTQDTLKEVLDKLKKLKEGK